jgi:hypothetical protein
LDWLQYELSEDEDDDPKKRNKKMEKLAKKMKELNPDLVYTKISFRGKNLKKVLFKGKRVENIFDFYDIRKRALVYKNSEDHNFDNIIGSNFSEHHFNKDDE